MYARPIELKNANAFVKYFHRHHDPVYRDKFRIACYESPGALIGVVHVGRPVARHLDDGMTCEVTRLCTDGTRNVCSFLYAQAAKAAKAMGYKKIITYILDSENGASLKASGFVKVADTRGGNWNCKSRPRTTTAPTVPKQRYEKILN